jgi:parvulin-like peptidyl-prolyl isomerase
MREKAGRARSDWRDFLELFEELAKEHSNAPSSARGGNVGIFFEDEDLVAHGAAFRDTLYSMKPGDLSAVIEGKEGVHLIKCFGVVRKTFAEARGEIIDSLIGGVDF